MSGVSHHCAALHPAKSRLSEMTKAESKEGPQLNNPTTIYAKAAILSSLI